MHRLAAALALSCALPLLAIVHDWGGHTLSPGRDAILGPGKRYVAQLQTIPRDTDGLLGVAFRDGRLILDTTRLLANDRPHTEFTLRIPIQNAIPDRDARLAVTLSATPHAPFELFFEGEATVNGKPKGHYWRVKTCLAGPEPQTFTFDQRLPADIRHLRLRLSFPKPAVFTLGDCSFTPSIEAQPIDADRENLVNGGAERGLYGLAYSDIGFLGSKLDGKHYDYRNIGFTGSLKVQTDDTTAHSGRRSFKVTTPPNSINTLFFQPVPTVTGKPISFSLWMKAAEPTTVGINLFPANAVTYLKRVQVTTEWQLFTLNVPEYGKDAPGVTRIGNPATTYGALYNLVFPRLDFPSDTTVWLDDLSSRLRLDTRFHDDAHVWLGGNLNHDSTVYHPGEPISAALSLEPARADVRQATLSWRVENVFGKAIASAAPRTVSLPAQERLDITVPQDARGWLTLIVTARDGDHTDEHVLPFGVIDRPRPVVRRFGINVSSPRDHNLDVTIAMMKRFRLGYARVWLSNGHGFEAVKDFHDAGIGVLFCLANVLKGKEAFFLPKDYTPWQTYLAQKVGEVRGMVDAYEILNEPNIWSGHSTNPDPERLDVVTPDAVARCIVATADTIRATDPKALIAGPDACGTNVPWIETVIAKPGVAQRLDIISEHPYRQLPELPDYAEDMRSLQQMARRHNPNYRFFSTEAGRVFPQAYPDNRILPACVVNTARDIRNEIIGFAHGVEAYFHFAMGSGHCQTAWGCFRPGNDDNHNAVMPSLYLYAVRAAADHLEDGKPAGQVRLGANVRCYLFDLGTHRVAALWKWNGNPETIRFSSTAALKAFDFMGSPIDGNSLPLGECPIYLESDLPTPQFADLIANAQMSLSDKAFRASVTIPAPDRFAVRITNLTARPLSGTVTVQTPGLVSGLQTIPFADIPAEETATVEFRTRQPISLTPASAQLRIDVPALNQHETLTEPLRALFVPKATSPITIDGSLDDWRDTPSITLTSRNAVQSVPWTDAMKRATVDFRCRWDDDRLYLAFHVRKDGFHPVDTLGEAATWQGDGIQLALDTIANAAKGTAGYQDDDFEYALSLYQGKPMLLRQAGSASTYDSLPKPLGRTDQGDCAIRQTPDGVVYELALPPISISPFRLVPGSATRFSFIVNLNDGNQRIGWLELTPGIGQSPKRPAQFLDLILLP
ncbi:MAG: glycoside hydrolase family 44 protein [Oligosphaeraceae bacterium]